ncbi:phosphoribosylglycinamide formyltransferase [Pasteurella skyensis]|uniref:Phosphoribosylglycinamide formyltransferase n=1 Tax=Phocoenobacter skyensis TaxID=97481 RepID=A0AAJ6N8N4_9PAST|nr:phosphoribosylglycinamide formyltransferase [Pasteurella skyensis]MDP8162069.1 phosphoribosylglycinamide formyltransferase [Pasteurella skyensis]MDP8172225.1 phosphoribosylglycinamide formyltransferase [Pasteurella skyensis]MDP8176426.1 phosphoribosylglycinamide formyltransferase [Pasteurella skyensis]MDP8178315.1 phosphoribosylglycinamide formyltransferase [Pasteurella skyensis]MDP8182929.1 phosphoribosylglycinamide formyltransferase [Pasteurella skyensis]
MSMKKPSGDKNIRRIVHNCLKVPNISLKKGKKHHFITNGVVKVPIPSTPSDSNSYKQFKRDIVKIFKLKKY